LYYRTIWNNVVPCDKARCVDVSWEVTVDCVVAKDACSVVVSVARECLWFPSGVEWGVVEIVVSCVDVTKVRTMLSVNVVRIGVLYSVVVMTFGVFNLVDWVNVVKAVRVLATKQRLRHITNIQWYVK